MKTVLPSKEDHLWKSYERKHEVLWNNWLGIMLLTDVKTIYPTLQLGLIYCCVFELCGWIWFNAELNIN